MEKKKSYLLTLHIAKIISVGETSMNECGTLVEWYWQGRENWPSATLTTTDPTWTFLHGGI
jgi:hypothetical protein